MYDAQMRDYWVIHVLPEERIIVEGVERYSVRAGRVSSPRIPATLSACSHSFSRSNWPFFGIISSMCGASSGYVSTTLVRMAR